MFYYEYFMNTLSEFKLDLNMLNGRPSEQEMHYHDQTENKNYMYLY